MSFYWGVVRGGVGRWQCLPADVTCRVGHNGYRSFCCAFRMYHHKPAPRFSSNCFDVNLLLCQYAAGSTFRTTLCSVTRAFSTNAFAADFLSNADQNPSPTTPTRITHELEGGSDPLVFELGRFARLADGSAVCSLGDTSILATVVKGRGPNRKASFYPQLRVNYRERGSATGRIPSNRLRRELSYTDAEILTARCIDRAVRPLIAPGYAVPVEVAASVLSVADIQGRTAVDVVALNAVSAAMSVAAGLPWQGPIGAVRVGLPRMGVDGKPESFVEPVILSSGNSLTQKQHSGLRGGDLDLEMLIACTRERKIVMLEFQGQNMPLDRVKHAVWQGAKHASAIAQCLYDSLERSEDPPSIPEDHFIILSPDVIEKVRSIVEPDVRSVLMTPIANKRERGVRMDSIKQAAVEQICGSVDLRDITDTADGSVDDDGIVENEIDGLNREISDELMMMAGTGHPKETEARVLRPGEVNRAFDLLVKEIARDVILKHDLRSDGRKPSELRPLSLSADVFPNLHGTGLVTKGESQVLSTLTYDSRDSAFQPADPIISSGTGGEAKTFMVNYIFNDFANNELSTGGAAANRRELGHSQLIEAALRPFVSRENRFTIRLVCEVLESAGSTSMAGVIAGFLALRDAGVILDLGPGRGLLPMDDAVAGIAVGVLSSDAIETGERDERGGDKASGTVAVLSGSPGTSPKFLMDISGFEDYVNDMDFKIASTKTGLTMGQFDCKLDGCSVGTLNMALEKAFKANKDVIKQMVDCLAASVEPRPKANMPQEQIVTLTNAKRAQLLRGGGYNLIKIQDDTGVKITKYDENSLVVFARSPASMQVALCMIDTYTADQPWVEQMEFDSIYTAKILEVREKGVVVSILPAVSEAFIPLRQLDTRRVGNATMLDLSVGQEIQVKYFGLDPDTGKPRLSRKILQRLSSLS